MLRRSKFVVGFVGKILVSLVCLGGLGAGLGNVAWASYTPPPDASAPSGSRTSSGVRGNCSGEPGGTAILAPRSHVGQSISPYPTVSWFIADTAPLLMNVSLYQIENGQEILLETLELETTPGLMQSTLAANQPPLKPDHQYLWQLVVICDPNSPSSALVDTVFMDVVSLPADLEAALAQATTPQARATLYAEAGLWYDALAAAADEDPPTTRQTLLQTLAAQEEASDLGRRFGELLRRIVEE